MMRHLLIIFWMPQKNRKLKERLTTPGTDRAHNIVTATRLLPFESLLCMAHSLQRTVTVSLHDSGQCPGRMLQDVRPSMSLPLHSRAQNGHGGVSTTVVVKERRSTCQAGTHCTQVPINPFKHSALCEVVLPVRPQRPKEESCFVSWQCKQTGLSQLLVEYKGISGTVSRE